MITPALYRAWAKTRLLNLSAWTQTWKIEGMFAGHPGVGAQDAWYSTAIDLEYAQCQHVAAEYKCSGWHDMC